jgi:hypothetical protein
VWIDTIYGTRHFTYFEGFLFDSSLCLYNYVVDIGSSITLSTRFGVSAFTNYNFVQDQVTLTGFKSATDSFGNYFPLAVAVPVSNPDFEVFPTLAHDQVMIKNNSGKKFEFEITDVHARRMLSGANVTTIDIRLLPPGIYFLFIESGDRKWHQQKFMVE